jgi:hypothetical protein
LLSAHACFLWGASSGTPCIYKPESCLENNNYKLYFDRRVLTDIHIQHNRPDIIILNKQQKQAYLLDIAVPNSHNISNVGLREHIGG